MRRDWHIISVYWLLSLVTFIYVGLPLFNKTVPTVPSEVFLSIGGVIGINGWKRINNTNDDTKGDK